MNWSWIAQAASDSLAVVLIIRLLSLKLHTVYRVFCAFLIFDVLSSLIAVIYQLVPHLNIDDYRVFWICYRFVSWVFYLCLVYGLLHAILLKLPGIYKASKRVLNVASAAVVAVSLITTRLDVSVSGTSGYLSHYSGTLGTLVRIAYDLERVISTVALLLLLTVLLFVLWFPVQMPRNLAVFSIGLVVFFAANTGLFLTRGLWSQQTLNLVSNAIMFVVTVCYAYLAVFITKQGEEVPVRMGHQWNREEQRRMMGQLEAINTALLRAARRQDAA